MLKVWDGADDSTISFPDAMSAVGSVADADTHLRQDFADPPQRYWPRPLWFWNNTSVTVETVRDQMRQARDHCRYGGFGILPFGKDFSPAYLSDEYFTVYGAALQQAKALGLTLSLYDEYGFPSGSAGSHNSSDTSLFAQRWPELTIKRLDKHEWEVDGPGPVPDDSAARQTVRSGGHEHRRRWSAWT